MITKAYVVSVNGYEVTLNIPIFHNVENSDIDNESLVFPTSCIAISYGVYPNLKKGDTVIIGFEDNNLNTPVILGALYTEEAKKYKSDAIFSSLGVNVNAELPEDTTIGNVKPESIKCLQNVREDLQVTLDTQRTDINTIDLNGSQALLATMDTITNMLKTFHNNYNIS